MSQWSKSLQITASSLPPCLPIHLLKNIKLVHSSLSHFPNNTASRKKLILFPAPSVPWLSTLLANAYNYIPSVFFLNVHPTIMNKTLLHPAQKQIFISLPEPHPPPSPIGPLNHTWSKHVGLSFSSSPNPPHHLASRKNLILLPAHLVTYTSILLEYLCCPPITVHLLPPCPPQLNHPVEVNPFPPPNPPRLSPLSPFSCHHLPFVLAHGILRTMARTIW